MELIERYVLEVEQHLPHRSAEDVGNELRSLLADSLEQRAARAGRAPTEEDAYELLREFGEPEEVAERYRGPRYLIGPGIFPTFEYTAWSVAVTIAIVSLLGNTVDFVVNGRTFNFGLLLNGIWKYVHNTFVALGMTVIVFAVLDRTTPEEAEEETAETWDPHELPPLPELESPRLSLREVERGLWGDALGLVLLNAFPRWLGIRSDGSTTGCSSRSPILACACRPCF